ncbi:hypothetical protein C8R45DRAFT_1102861 [Mycena sanguinolenta]|nr:hypothetical protein C8R45DRAFT_1102861 [Mycena sanguinolenta]
MAPCVESGHEILVPVFGADCAESLVHIHWQQDFAQRKADYYALTVDNITTGETVPFFIAAEYYKNSTKANAHHITKVAELVDGALALHRYFPLCYDPILTSLAEGYKMKVDNKLQYGQKNAEGELRFVVYHDQEHKPYQVSVVAITVICALASFAAFPPLLPFLSLALLPAVPAAPYSIPFISPSLLEFRLLHRFMETALGSAGAAKAQQIAAAMGFGAVGDSVNDLAQAFVGDYMHTF